MARTYKLHMQGYDISDNRYMELKYFCLQYEDKKRMARDILLSYSGSHFDSVPSSNWKNSSVVEAKMLKRDTLLHDIKLIESCAQDVQEGEWYSALIDSCCRGRNYDTMDKSKMPTSHRKGFYDARKEFYALLDHRQKGLPE